MTTEVSDALMDDETAALWRRISTAPMKFSGGGTLAAVLREESALEGESLQIALEEYRRYLLLAVLDGPAAASSLIESIRRTHQRDAAAWAWYKAEVLGAEPRLAWVEDPAHMDPNYIRTFQHYEALFGRPPHKKVWPGLRLQKVLHRLGRVAGFGLGIFVLCFLFMFTTLVLRGKAAENAALTGFFVCVVSFLIAFCALIVSAILGPWTFSKEDASSGGMGGD